MSIFRAAVILWYSKEKKHTKFRALWSEKSVGLGGFTDLLLRDGSERKLSSADALGRSPIPDGARVFRLSDLTKPGPGARYDIEFQGKTYSAGARWWGTTPEGMAAVIRAGRVRVTGTTMKFIRFLDDFPLAAIANIWTDTGIGYGSDKRYVVETSTRVIERCILMTTDPGDLVLDPTCGSGTTAFVAEQWGRRWITTDTSRVALALARTRLMAARFPYYLLADSVEGRAKQTTLTGKPTDPAAPAVKRDLHSGFVYKTVPHVTLKSIANNPDIDAIHAQAAPVFAQLLQELNAALGTKWNEWDVPPLPPAPGWSAAKEVLEQWAAKAKQTLKDWSEKARRLLERWWEEKKKYRMQIDAAISRHADSETLFDQPYEDKSVVRLTGPFTVESLSPHKALATPAEPADARTAADAVRPAANYHQTIRENLLKAGVKGTDKAQRIALARLDAHPGRYIHAEGETTDGTAVRVSIGPDSGTVGDAWIADAAVEAKKGSQCDLLLVCAFAFEASVHEKTAELAKEMKLGNLRVLPVRMNPDLVG